MELIYLASQASFAAVLTRLIQVLCLEVTWIRLLCIAGSAIPACFFLPNFFTNRSQESTRFDPVTAVATSHNHKQAT